MHPLKLIVGSQVFDDYDYNDENDSRCEEWKEAGYECVPYYTCDECNKIITDGSSLFDPRDGDPEDECGQSEMQQMCRALSI